MIRVFGDPMGRDEDRSWLFNTLKEEVESHLDSTVYDLFKHLDLDMDGTVDVRNKSTSSRPHLPVC